MLLPSNMADGYRPSGNLRETTKLLDLKVHNFYIIPYAKSKY